MSFTSHAIGFLLVLSRLGGLFVFAPILASTTVPLRARAMFAIMLAAAMYPTVSLTAAPSGDLDIASLLPIVLSEALVGLSIGLLAAIPIFSVQLAGMVMGQQMGLSLAGVYNPAIESESDTLGEILLYMAMGVFVILGGLEALFLAVARSFERVPMGGFGIARVPLDHLTGLVSAGFELALRVAAPLLCIILLETIATAFIMKTIPQLNIMSIGFALKILLGFLAIVAALAAVHQVIGDHVSGAIRFISHWAQTLCLRPALITIRA